MATVSTMRTNCGDHIRVIVNENRDQLEIGSGADEITRNESFVTIEVNGVIVTTVYLGNADTFKTDMSPVVVEHRFDYIEDYVERRPTYIVLGGEEQL